MGTNISGVVEFFFKCLPQKPKLSKVYLPKVRASGANLGSIGQCDLTFQLGNKHFRDRFIALQDLWRNLILVHNWQCNYRIGYNWNVNGQQYIAHNKIHLCTVTTSSQMEPIIHNVGSTSINTKNHICNSSRGTSWAEHKTYLSTKYHWWSTIRSYSPSRWP